MTKREDDTPLLEKWWYKELEGLSKGDIRNHLLDDVEQAVHELRERLRGHMNGMISNSYPDIKEEIDDIFGEVDRDGE